MSQRTFSKIQFGLESVKGTAVAADTILAFQAQQIPPDRRPYFPAENLGIRMEAARSVVHQYKVEYNLTTPDGYFQALPILLSMLLKGNITPAEQNPSEGDYLWTFNPDMTFGASNALDSITIEVGDDQDVVEAEYCMLENLRISGQISQDSSPSPVSISGSLFGRQWTDSSFTGSLSNPTMTPLNAKLARVYKDSAWTNLGTTELTNTLRGFDLQLIGGAHPKFLGSANKYFDSHGQGAIGAMLALTMERGTASDAIWDDLLANTYRVIQLDLSGPLIGVGDPHLLSIKLAGYFEEVIPLQSQDRGNNIDTALFRAVYDDTDSGTNGVQVEVTTNVSAI